MPRTQTRCQVIIFLGPPGSGKGTQAAQLSSELGIPAISTGDMLRREVQSGSRLGINVENVLASGGLVGDELVNQVVASRLSNRDCDAGCILDGYPRTVSQARFLNRFLRSSGKNQPIIFDFEIAAAEIVARISHRRQCTECGRIFSIDAESGSELFYCDRDGSTLIQRADDRPEVVRERLRQYDRNSRELLRYYRKGNYHLVHASRSPAEICDELLNTLAAGWPVPILSRAAVAIPQASFSV